MDSIIADLLQKRIEEEMNKVLSRLELKVDKVEFNFSERPAVVINLRTISLSGQTIG